MFGKNSKKDMRRREEQSGDSLLLCLLMIVVQDLPARSDLVPIGYQKGPSFQRLRRVDVSKIVRMATLLAFKEHPLQLRRDTITVLF